MPRRTPRRRGGCCGPLLLLLLVAFLAVPYLLGRLPDLLGDAGGTQSEPTPLTSPSDAPGSSPGWPGLTRTTTASWSPPSAESAAGGTVPGTPAATTTYPGVTIVGHECPRLRTSPYAGIGASATTSCAFAVATRSAYLASAANGQATTLRVYSTTRQATVTLSCRGTRPVSCTSGDSMAVYLYDGEATFRS